MTLPRIAAAVLAVTAAFAHAEEPDLEPTWSLGAGLSYTFGGGLLGLGALGTASGGLGGLTVASSPSLTPNVSLERAFSSHFALGLGVEAGTNSISVVGVPQRTLPSGSVAIGLSPRFTLTKTSAPVAFTLFATLATGFAGSGSVVSILTPTPMEVTSSTQTFAVGATGGIALEKRVFERLAVRIQAQLARVSLNRFWTTSQLSDSEGGVVNSRNVASVVNANLVPSPSIELRLYL
ncbi:MAG: hypothetical protein GQE15_01870 [Archangiaceae bacterium]|nr:hypothetical protein [Archangiaceae bacterium]